jgi:hypothetical protein
MAAEYEIFRKTVNGTEQYGFALIEQTDTGPNVLVNTLVESFILCDSPEECQVQIAKLKANCGAPVKAGIGVRF